MRRCNVTDVLTDTVLLLEARCPDRSVVLEAREPVFARGDAGQLRQVFLNLGLNALEAMQRPGTLRIRVEVRETRPRFNASEEAEQGTRTVCVSFEDDGEGFEPMETEQLFVPFYTTKTRGTGLGLAVARRIVEGHKGAIEVYSRPGYGSRFTVCLEGCPVTAERPVLVSTA
jgi:signal transduction histidine kinase